MTLLKNGSSVSVARAQAARRPCVQPFVCSTFKDFSSERDFLQEQIFPKLDKCCRERGSRFSPIDLRWNKSQSQIGSEHVLRVCLDSIALCAPYFICILGERYGVHRAVEGEPEDSKTGEWLEKNFEVAAASGHQWVLEEENRHNSLTELEVIQSSFRKKYDHGYFYFRDPLHIEDKLKKVHPSSEQDSIMDTFKSESDYCARKIRELKQQIIDTDLPVRHFRTLDELGERVYRDWLGIIDNLYPTISASVFRNADSEEYHEWAAHEMFAETKRKIFIKNLKIREIGEIMTNHAVVNQDIKTKTSFSLPAMMMSTFMTSVPGDEKGLVPPLMILEGDRGCGKSSLAANWVKQVSSFYPELPIIPHYVGSSTYSYDVTNFMRRCTKELRLHFLNSDYDDLMENKDISDYRCVVEAFHASLSLGPCVILIDGADDFGTSADVPMFKAKEMQWLPSEIPSFCRLIITTSKADITFKALRERRDAYVVVVPQLFDSSTKRCLLKEYIGIDSKSLDEDCITKITTAKLSELPIFYVAIASELQHFHGSKNADRQLDAYVQATSLGELWNLILRRWVRDYGWLMPAATRGPASMKAQVSRDRSNSGWVADALRLFAVSRNGLTVEEILGSLKIMGYVRNHEVTTAHWTVFNLVSQNVLASTSQGLLTFFHQSVRAAVENALLRSLTSSSQERVISPFKDIWERQKLQCHNVLANYFDTVQPATTRTVEELPWQHRISGNLRGLSKSLSNPITFVTLMHSERELYKKLDLLCYWKTLEADSQNPVNLLQQMVKDSQGKLEPERNSKEDVSSANIRIEDLSAVEMLCKKRNEDFFKQMELAVISFFAGKFLAEQNKHAAAEELLLSAYKYGYPVASVRDLSIITQLQEALGNLYFCLSVKERAEYWYRGALKTATEQTRVVDKVHHEALIGRILNRLAIILLGNICAPPSPSEGRPKTSPRMGRPKTPSVQRSPSAASGRRYGNENVNFEEIGSLLNESLKHLHQAGVVPGKTAVYFQMGLSALRQKQYEDAESLLRKALSIREQWYGSSHPLVAEIIETMATVLSLDGLENSDPVLAEKMYRKALHMREEAFGSGDLTVADTLVNLGKLLQQKNAKDATREAKELLQRALDIRTTKLGVYHLDSKLVRRDLMFLETTDAAAKLSSKGPARELKALQSSGSKIFLSCDVKTEHGS